MRKRYIGHNEGKIANINKSRKMGEGEGGVRGRKFLYI